MLIIKEKYLYFLIAIILIQFNNCYSQSIKCVQCNDCKTEIPNPTDCTDTGATQCFTQIDTTGKIERGCKTPQEAENCKTENNCVLTEKEKNNQLICKKCDTSDEKCSQTDMSLNDLKYNEICKDGVNSCLIKIDNKLVMRGCNSEKTECKDENTCKTCTAVNCNTGVFPTKRINCYQCSGSNCLDVSTNTELTKPCLNYVEDDKCYTQGKSETDMIRGCQSDTKYNQYSSTTEKSCLLCSTDNCNNLKYKYDQKLKCHQCESSDPTNDCFKEQTNKELKNCQNQILYNAEEYCYARVDNGAIQRGCLHDNAKVTLDNCADNEACTKCNSADGCNSKSMSTKFTCIVCRSDENENCRDNADKLEGTECRTSESSIKDGCFTGIWNGVVIRGCLVDASIQNQEICKDKENNQCHLCQTGNNCNKEKTSGAHKIGIQFSLFLVVLTILWNLK